MWHSEPKNQDGQRKPLAVLPLLGEDPLVTVVVPALDEERYIGACLESLVAQDYPSDRLEVLVADGGSKDRTRRIVTEVGVGAPFPVRLIENPGRTTPHGLNAGFAASRGEVIIILSAHGLADARFVSASVLALRETGAAAAGGPIDTRGDGSVADAIAAGLSHPFGVGDARFRFATEPGYVDTIAFAAYRRECFEALGGFDADREKAEDDFFNYRIRRAGGRLFLTPEVSSVYFARSTYRSVARQYFAYGKAKGRTGIEEPASVQIRHVVPSGAVAIGGVLALAGVSSGIARWALLLLGVLYASAAGYAGVRASMQRGRLELAPLTAATFPVVHASYGVGAIAGAVAALLRRQQPVRAP